MARLDDSLWLAVWMCMRSEYQLNICVCVCATACMHVHLSVSKLKSYVDEFTVNFHFNTVILVYP